MCGTSVCVTYPLPTRVSGTGYQESCAVCRLGKAKSAMSPQLSPHCGILNQVVSEQKAERATRRSKNKTRGVKKKQDGASRDRKKIAGEQVVLAENGAGIGSQLEEEEEDKEEEEENIARQLEVQCRGAGHVLKQLVNLFGEDVFQKVAKVTKHSVQFWVGKLYFLKP